MGPDVCCLRSNCVRVVLLVLAVSLPVTTAGAQGVAENQQRALFELVVNHVPKGQSAAILNGRDLWLPVDSFEAADIYRIAGERRVFYDRTFVRLGSLQPSVTFDLDEQELALHLTVHPDHLSETKVSLQPTAPAGIVYSRASSGFLNYAIDWNAGGNHTAYLDAGLSAGGALVNTTLMRNGAGAFVRGYSTVTVDDRRRLRRWVIGDSFANTGLLGGGVVVGGVSVGTEYGLDPYFMRYPSAELAGAVMSPSTLEVYVNDRLVGREQLLPGRFDLTSLPVSSGRADTRLVLRDVFGREQELVSSFYLATGGLADGQHEYRYTAGYRRRNDATSSFDYSGPAILARHRLGLTDGLTAGLRIETSGSIASGGPMMNVRFPVGELEVAAAGSRHGSVYGGAASARYTYVSVKLNLAAALRYVSPHYATLGTLAGPGSPRWTAGISGGIPFRTHGSVTVRHDFTTGHDHRRGSTSSILGSVRLSRRSYLTISGTNDRRSQRRGLQLSASVGVVVGPRMGTNLAQTFGADGNHSTAELQRSLPLGTGLGYRVSGDLTSRVGHSSAQFQGPYGQYQLTHDRVGGRQTTAAHASGGIVAIGGGLYATRPVQDGFALVKVPGVAHVRAYASHQQVGRTDRHGNLLVPGLLPYHGNTLSIADHDIPLDRSVETTERIIAPPYRGGALVTFPVRRARHTIGRVMLRHGDRLVVPAYGQLTLVADAATYGSPIGAGGEFYFEDLPAGRYTATVLFEQRTCEFTVTTGSSADDSLQLGTLECRAASAAR